MKRHRPPTAHHPGARPKLWLPSSEADQGSTGKEECQAGGDEYREEVRDDEEDDLDKLMNQYEAQAAQDLQRARSRTEQQQPGKQNATQRREAALEQPLAPDNKGFKMLAAMGYQEGQGLGKSVMGRSEPIPLDLKQNRLGLGAVNKKAAAREAQRQRERQGSELAKRAHHEAEASIHAGRQRTAEQFAARREAAQLRKAQKVCESLDAAGGITCNYLWTPPPHDKAATAATAATTTTAAAAAAAAVAPSDLPGYGGSAAAAAWPGRGRGGVGGLAGAADDELLEESEFFRRDLTGPGQEAEDGAEARRYARAAARWGAAEAPDRPAQHAAAAKEDLEGGEWDPAAAAQAAAWQELPVQRRLEDVLHYLREQYLYCLYCGCRYNDEPDLAENCPGVFEADHD